MLFKEIDRQKSQLLWGDGVTIPSVAPALTMSEKEFREKCMSSFDAFSKYSEYDLDWRFASALYFRILPLSGKFTLRFAANNGIWRRLSICVIPDFVALRWPSKEGVFPADRFWLKPQRIWLKSLWWYAHLSCQGDDLLSTECCLKNGSTDSIQQLIDRHGLGGFRVELCREIMRRIGDKSLSVPELRKLLKLNTTKVPLVEPLFYVGGVQGYVDSLLQTICLDV
jgi:hypothetical protein